LTIAQEEHGGSWTERGRTEVISGDASPVFIKTFTVHYYFEKQQRFKLEVLNAEGDTEAQHRVLGAVNFSIHELVCSQTHSLTKTIKNWMKFSNGYLTVTSNEIPTQHKLLTMCWRLEDCSWKRPVYIRICRSSESEFLPVYKSELVNARQRTADFRELRLTTHALCRDELSRPVKVQVHEESGLLIGEVETSLAELKHRGYTYKADILQGSRKICTLKLVLWDCTAKTTFLDYVLGGCEISLVIGIDFTKSNGLPSDPESLHFMSNEKPNEYIQAITAVGEILQYYDSDKRIPVFGFGAKLPPKFESVSHCFALNDNIFDPEVYGIESVLQVYRQALTKVVLHGPTVFSQIIKTVSLYAAAKEVSQERQNYCILLILTDGIINDMEATKEEIIAASKLPVSIIVVGVGKEDFNLMKDLDSDEAMLHSNKHGGSDAVRDIVQFVPFSKYKDRLHDLAREVLYEVPKQLLTFFESKQIRPNPSQQTGEGLPSFRAMNSQAAHHSTRRQSLPSLVRAPLIPHLLQEAKQTFLSELCSLGYDLEAAQEVIEDGLPALDIQLAVELLSLKKAKQSRVLKSALRKSSGGITSRTVSIKEAVRCVQCEEREVDTVLVECGHSVLCSGCVARNFDRMCPKCRQSIVKWILIQN
jgi:hypothetical protein